MSDGGGCIVRTRARETDGASERGAHPFEP